MPSDLPFDSSPALLPASVRPTLASHQQVAKHGLSLLLLLEGICPFTLIQPMAPAFHEPQLKSSSYLHAGPQSIP